MRFELITVLAFAASFAAAARNDTLSSGQISSTSSRVSASNVSSHHLIGTTSIITSSTRTRTVETSASATETSSTATETSSTATSTGASSPSSSSTPPNAADVVAVNSLGAFVLALGALAAGQLL